MADLFAVENEAEDTKRPLADRLRPRTIDEVAGQDHIVGEDGTLRKTLEGGHLPSIIFWGPPGCGKTTLARILADHTDLHFEQLSAIFSGVADLRKVFDAAKIRKKNGQGTLLFVDEIHRFNKSQQDAFLPVMEDGTITLIGATTENPSFELNAALLSRAQVLVLKRLDDDALENLLKKAEQEKPLPLSDEARELLKTLADGDGRAAAGRDRQLEPAVVQGVERDFVASADLPEHVLRRHADVLEDHGGGGRAVQAHLVLLVAGAHPREAPFDQKGGELLAVHLGEDDEEIGESPVRDPHLLPAQHEAAVVLPGRARLGAERIRPGAGLAQTVGPDPLAADELAQILVLLGVGAEAAQRDDRQPGVRPEGRPERPALSDAAGHDDRGGLVELDAAVGLRDVGAHQPELTRATDQAARQVPVLRFELVVVRHDLLGDELLGGLIDEPVLVGESFGGEDRAGRGLLEEPGPSGDAGRRRCHRRHEEPLVEKM